jgi:hypothetical protein
LKPNIGIANALIRITFGLTIVAWSTAKMTRRPFHESYILTALLGAMKVAEGITRYCPVTDLYQKSQKINEFGLDDIAKNNVDQGEHQGS